MALENIVSGKNIPKILEQRLLINETHRKILGTMDELAPRNNSNLYMHDFSSDDVPSIENIAKKTGLKPSTVRKSIDEIKNIWEIPSELPTGRGKLNEEQSLIYALTNQHRTRYDSNIQDYRVKTIQILTGEVGAGMLYTRKDSFKGEEIIREAMGWNEYLTAYHLQGGHMPIIMQMYGKVKKERAKLVGVSHKEPTGETLKELDEMVKHIELAESSISGHKKKLSDRDIEKLKKNVIGTNNTFSQAGESAAEELQYIFKNARPHTQFFVYSSYNDDANRDEINDQQVTKYRMAKDKAAKAKKELPKLEEEIQNTRVELAQEYVNLSVGEDLYKTIDRKSNIPQGNEFREILSELAKNYSKRTSKQYKKAKETYEKRSETKDFESFQNAHSTAINRFVSSSGVKSKEEIKKRIEKDEEKKNSLNTKLSELKIKKEEYDMYVTAYDTEKEEGIGWFTKKVSMNNTEAKALYVVTKDVYNGIIKKDLFGNIRDRVENGDELNLNYISDSEISVYIPDPAERYKLPIKYKHLPGQILTSVPRVNKQKSNEPVLGSLHKLQKKHEDAVASRVANPKEKPKSMKEFMERKYHLTAYSNILVTSHGAEGLQHMVKDAIAQTQVEGEYRGELEKIHYIKVPTRHDMGVLAEFMKKGNTGTWEAKRLVNGGPTTGFSVITHHTDGSLENRFIHDKLAETVEKTYGTEYRQLQSDLKDSKKSEITKQKLETLYSKVREEMKMYHAIQANDLHFGAFNGKGAPNNVDYIKASQVHILQTYGLKDLHALTGTEFVNGYQKWKSYDSSLEGQLENPVMSSINTNLIAKGLREKFLKNGHQENSVDKLVVEYLKAFENEKMYAKATHRPDDQLKMFKIVEWPLFMELLENNVPLYIGTGNHWKSGTSNLDESTVISDMFDEKYNYLGLMQVKDAHGQSFTTAEIRLPGTKGGVKALFTHKMWSGSTEIDVLSRQALGHKSEAQIYLMGDRHHPGFVVEHEKAFVLDAGKQGTMPYVFEIGKGPSSRGSIVFGYAANGSQSYSTRFFLDNVVDRIIKWDEESKILKECYDTATAGKKNAAINLIEKQKVYAPTNHV